MTDADTLQAFVDEHPRLVILTGAGISLAAGIPTYRDSNGVWRHSEPVQHNEFLNDHRRRQRYWLRSMNGWPAVRDSLPTAAHSALAALEQRGSIELTITQNVDRLHQRAGAKNVTDLHGRLDRVICLDCGVEHTRDEVQEQMNLHNTATPEVTSTRPDGDAELDSALEQAFTVPHCRQCKGILKPDVVFFGGTVPKARVQTCMEAIERADALLTVGSSLQVYSGFRFCRKAVELGKPLAIINPGKTRADDIANLKIHADCQELLSSLDSFENLTG